MKTSWTRLITTIAMIIIGVWLIMLALRFATWLINGLVGIAALVLVVALVYRALENKRTHVAKQEKGPLKIEREPSQDKESN